MTAFSCLLTVFERCPLVDLYGAGGCKSGDRLQFWLPFIFVIFNVFEGLWSTWFVRHCGFHC